MLTMYSDVLIAGQIGLEMLRAFMKYYSCAILGLLCAWNAVFVFVF